jgi:hypothetical protein
LTFPESRVIGNDAELADNAVVGNDEQNER